MAPSQVDRQDNFNTLGLDVVGSPGNLTPGLLDGEPLNTGDLVIRFGWWGDANTDGQVDSGDYNILAANFSHAGNWFQGDFNYDGVVNFSDLVTLSQNYGNTTPLPPAAENEPYSFTLPGDTLTNPDGFADMSAITGWQVRWGDGTSTSYPVAAGASPDITASHIYATPNLGNYPLAILAYGIDAYGNDVSYILPHQDVVVAPDAPTSISATESTTSTANLSWSDDSNIATGYTITATPSGAGTAITQSVNSSAFAAAITGLTADESYTFAVTADNTISDGLEASSAPATLTAAAPAHTLSATGPTSIAEGSTATNNLTLASGTSSNITGWQVVWTDESGTVLSTDTVTGARGTDAYPSPMPLELTAVVTAYDSAGNAFVLPTFTADLVPSAPTDLAATVFSSTEIDLSWVDHSSIATDDLIYESTDGGTMFNPIDQVTPNAAGAANTYAATGLTPDVSYEFYVSAETGYAESADSNTVTASTPFVAPTLDVEGSGTVVEGQPYELDLTAEYPDGEAGTVDHWLVDWNDGTGGTSDVISYSYPTGADTTQPLAVTHVFNAGIASPNVVVTAVDSANSSFVADPQPVTVTPTAPSELTASADGDSINVNFDSTSAISSGTTLLISTDDVTFYEAAESTTTMPSSESPEPPGESAVGAATGTISDLSTDTQYWVEAVTRSVNGLVSAPQTAGALSEAGATGPVTGSQWFEYFQDKYGAGNVDWARLPEYGGGKTTGILATSVGDVDLLSGWAGRGASMPKGSAGFNIITRSHVEGHAAAALEDLGLSDGTLYLNRIPCGGVIRFPSFFCAPSAWGARD